MKTTIEAFNYKNNSGLMVEIGEDQWGDNIVITRVDTDLTSAKLQPVSISFPLDVEAARAVSFALGELAKELGKRK